MPPPLSPAIDLLIGADYYWSLVTGNICKGDGGPTAIQTRLGWVISGSSIPDESNQFITNLSVTHVLHIEADS